MSFNGDESANPVAQSHPEHSIDPTFSEVYKEDIDDFEAFFRSWYRPLNRLLLTLTYDRFLAEDVVQETMISMKNGWEEMDEEERPRYLVQIGIRILRRIEARMRRENESINSLLRLSREEYVAPDENEWVITHQDIVREIRSLPHRQGEVAALFYLCDFTLADVAKILDLSTGAVKYHLHYARKSLRGRMDGSTSQGWVIQ